MTYNSLNGTTVNNHRGKYIFLQFQSLDHLTSWTSWGPYKKSGSVNQNVGISVRLKRNGSNLIAVPKARLVVHGAMGCGQESFKLVWRCHQLLSVFLAEGHLPRVSCLWANYRVIMKWYRGLCTDLLVFTLQAKKKKQLGDRRWWLCGESSPQIGSLPPQMMLSGREMEEKDGWVSYIAS